MEMTNHDEGIVFLSYTSADHEVVAEIADALSGRQIDVWMDKRRLKPGQNWDFEIRRALDRSVIIVVFVSHNSVKKTGYVQREIRLALDKAEEKLIDDIYLIPVLLNDDVQVPSQLKDVQFIRYSEDEFLDSLSDAIKHQLERKGAEVVRSQEDAELNWISTRIKERREGLPGYEAEIQFYKFYSSVFPAVSQIGEYVKGDLMDHLFDLRSMVVEGGEHFNFGQSRFFRTHTLDIGSSGPSVHGRIISILYNTHVYYAGSAHPNHGFSCYNFFIDPLIRIKSFRDVFEDAEIAFPVLQQLVRSELKSLKIDDEDDPILDAEMIDGGTNDWDCFECFTFGNDGIQIHFPPYQVGPYAAGPHTVEIPYKLVKNLIRSLYQSALDIEYIDHQIIGS
ncbi:TIR domain-containing protein [Rhizobium sp. PL01]|uniref:TIR domain-containing protein n=1 Tax=Rhizobium sp. PL01 TaxID=3085631 RepID=UPI0029816748|nr:TIR domain-containing protein [Rhizobium sp. PL01]MDW5313772.1 TIR domain-containing protein [Rhizobium sp. PL01]